MTALVQLTHGKYAATIAPGIGGALVRLKYGELDILRPTPDKAIEENLVRQMASYPLVPYSNRIVNAKLKFAGREHALRPNFGTEPHAIHGVGWQRAWQPTRASSTQLQLVLNHEPDADWPFHCVAHQRFDLTADALRVELALTNSGSVPMPAGLGFHPFFPRTGDTTLETRWQGLWTMSEAKVPIEHRAIPSDADFSKALPIGAWRIDNCFTGWSGKATLGYATHRTELTASGGFGHCVCFVPTDNRPFIALEPVSHIIDAFNLAARGVQDTGMRVLKPGETWAESMTLRVLEHRS
ncbi:MAG: aldose 1-epimerase [Betaproteobacteria bacterium]|nr:aldose 1-epimerase [Betaproteobacteria bacterium]